MPRIFIKPANPNRSRYATLRLAKQLARDLQRGIRNAKIRPLQDLLFDHRLFRICVGDQYNCLHPNHLKILQLYFNRKPLPATIAKVSQIVTMIIYRSFDSTTGIEEDIKLELNFEKFTSRRRKGRYQHKLISDGK